MTPVDYRDTGRRPPSRTRAGSSWPFASHQAPTSGRCASEMAPITGGFERVIGESSRRPRILNISRVRSVLQIVEGFAALLTLLVLVHSLSTESPARRRHDLGVLRAIGMRPEAGTGACCGGTVEYLP